MYAVHAKKVLLYLKGRMDEGRVCPPFEFFCNVLLTESRVFRRRQTTFAAMPANRAISVRQSKPMGAKKGSIALPMRPATE